MEAICERAVVSPLLAHECAAMVKDDVITAFAVSQTIMDFTLTGTKPKVF